MHMTLHNYLRQFGLREILAEDCWELSKQEMRFVTEQKFSSLFSTSGVRLVLPDTCKDLWQVHQMLRKELDGIYTMNNAAPGSSERVNKIIDAQDKNDTAILEKIEQALSNEFGDETFDYLEVSDNQGNYDENENGCYSQEDETKQRIELVDSIKKLKFWRKFSNH